MMTLTSKFSAFFAILGLAVSANAIEFKTFSLENGLDVVVVPDTRTPVVVHSVWYQAGSADEPAFAPGKGGIAHMLEHLMFKGQASVGPGEFSKIVAQLGGVDNAFTSRDYTAYYQKIGPQNLERMMQLEAERMTQLEIAPDTFLPERDVVREERRLRVETNPLGKFFERLVETHYGDHPYAKSVIGSGVEIENYQLADAERWYEAHYRPNNAILLLVGDVTAANVKEMIEATYGQQVSGTVLPRNWQSEPMFPQAQRISMTDPQVQVPVFYRLYRAPSSFAGIADGEAASSKERAALMVLADVLGHGSRGLFYRELVENQQIATAASMNYSPVLAGESTLDLFAQPKPNVTLAELETAITELLMKAGDAISTDAVELTKTQLRANWLYQQDDPFGVAYRLGRWLIAGGTPESYDDWLTALAALTVEDVRTAWQQYLIDTVQYTTGRLVAVPEQLGD